ncbi:hypothetical protein P5673_000081 [Acropora cervicornis]|uniref:Uncharacterized protein n=1 Tax=Acropora cervicornis TaxID=6130 RepID=A0AAD9R6J6_ACRCE|nr:hypothetical protein P5673_000081 [Acropora cervicornis]
MSLSMRRPIVRRNITNESDQCRELLEVHPITNNMDQFSKLHPPYGQQFGAVQAAPVGPPYGYNQQFGAVQAAPVGVYVSPHPAPVVTSEVKVELKAPAPNVVVVEPPERDCYFYCFDISGDYEWALLDFPASAALAYRWSRCSRSDAYLDGACMLLWQFQ